MWYGVILGGSDAMPDGLIQPVGDAISVPGQWQYTSYEPTVGSGTTKPYAAPSRAYGPTAHTSTPPGASTKPNKTLSR